MTNFTDMQGIERPENPDPLGVRRRTSRQREAGLLKRLGAMPFHFHPNRIRHMNDAKIRQQLDTAQFIQMDQRPGIGNDHDRTAATQKRWLNHYP